MLCFFEIAIFIVGMVILWKGAAFSGRWHREGRQARIVGLLLISPPLIGATLGFIIGVLVGMGELPKSAQSLASIVEVVLLFTTPLAAGIFALLARPSEPEISFTPTARPPSPAIPTLKPASRPSSSRMKPWEWAVLVAEVILVLGILSVVAWLFLFNKPNVQQTAQIVTPIAVGSTPTPALTSTPFVWPTQMSTGTPRPASTRVVASAVTDPTTLSKIEQRVTGLRGLGARAPVLLKFVTRSEATDEQRKWYEAHGDEMLQETSLYRALGLIQPGTQLDANTLSTMWGSSLGGYFRTTDKAFMVVTDLQNTEIDEKAITAHQYASGILEQRFNCSQLYTRARSTDARMATAALAQGDAALVSFFYLYGGMTQRQMEYVLAFRSKLYDPPIIPTGVSTRVMELQYFSSWHGIEFVATLGTTNGNFGWAPINRAYSGPPQSTTQVLHPEHYRSRVAPVAMSMPDLGSALGQGWTPIIKPDTLGEFTTFIHLEEFLLDRTRATQAADGWKGDSFTLWQMRDNRQVFAWQFEWDTPRDADEFFEAYSDLLHRRAGSNITVEREDADLHWYTSKTGSGLIRRAGSKALVVWGPDKATVERILSTFT